jgi:DNA polymerase II small subunit/DNA polymerase delta subunit B
MIEEQLIKLIQDADELVKRQELLDEQEEIEEEVSWIDAQTKLSEEEKLTVLKSVARYYYSDEFKSLVKDFSDKCTSIDEKIRETVRERKKTEATASFIDRCVVYMDVTEEIKNKTANQTFKNYLQARIDSLDSMIVSKKGVVAVTKNVELLVDTPIFTDVDLLKAQKEIYISVDAFMKYLVSLYDVK